jgi:GAF domain-containing protein
VLIIRSYSYGVTSKPAQELAETLIELADALSAGFDLDDFLGLLANHCVRLLEVDAAGVFLIDHGVVASHEHAAALERAAQRHGEGPWQECCRARDHVAVPDLAREADRWPNYVLGAREAGFAAAHALPMVRRDELVGTVTVFRTRPGALDTGASKLAQIMADIATIGILGTRALRKQQALTTQLQHALDSRVVIEQAKGVLAERFGLDVMAAFQLLRDYARSHNTRVSELASSIVDGQFDTNLLRPTP